MKTARNFWMGRWVIVCGWRMEGWGDSCIEIVFTSHFTVTILQCSLLSKLLETILTQSLCQQACQAQIEPPARRDSHLDLAPREPSFRP